MALLTDLTNIAGAGDMADDNVMHIVVAADMTANPAGTSYQMPFSVLRTAIGVPATILNPLTTGQRDALTPTAGWMVFNTTTGHPNYWNGSAWVEI